MIQWVERVLITIAVRVLDGDGQSRDKNDSFIYK